MQEKVRSLSSILADIEHEARQRQSLSADIIQRIYEHYTYLKAKLFELYIFPITGNRALESRRSALERQLDALKQEDRRERVLCWQDVAKLRRDHGDADDRRTSGEQPQGLNSGEPLIPYACIDPRCSGSEEVAKTEG